MSENESFTITPRPRGRPRKDPGQRRQRLVVFLLPGTIQKLQACAAESGLSIARFLEKTYSE